MTLVAEDLKKYLAKILAEDVQKFIASRERVEELVPLRRAVARRIRQIEVNAEAARAALVQVGSAIEICSCPRRRRAPKFLEGMRGVVVNMRGEMVDGVANPQGEWVDVRLDAASTEKLRRVGGPGFPVRPRAEEDVLTGIYIGSCMVLETPAVPAAGSR